MKKKELKKMAEQMLFFEKTIQDPSSTKQQIQVAKEGILYLSSRIEDPEDMMFIDDYIQNNL